MTPAIVHAFRAASAAARIVPPGLSIPVARVIGRLVGHADRDRRHLVERNLRRILGHDLSKRDLRRSVDAVLPWLVMFADVSCG